MEDACHTGTEDTLPRYRKRLPHRYGVAGEFSVDQVPSAAAPTG